MDTRDSKRTLDLNDHIINFLNANSLEEDVVIGHKEEPPPLKYDAEGKAIPSMGSTFSELYKKQGFGGFYRGLEANVMRAVVLNGACGVGWVGEGLGN